MYPVLFRLGQFEITSFGVAVAVAAIVGWQILSRELRAAGLTVLARRHADYSHT